MISNRTLNQINKISGGDFKKSEIKARRKRVIHTDDADTVVQVGDSLLRLTKTHRPVKHVIHSRTNLYKSVRAVWDLASVMDIELSHDEIKGHVDKYIMAVTDILTPRKQVRLYLTLCVQRYLKTLAMISVHSFTTQE